MKNTLSIICLLICMVFSSQIEAQPVNPDLTRMRLLLAKIADCSNDQKNLEAELEAMKKTEPNVNPALYAQAKKNLAIANKCKAAAQQQYDDLRADYEGWFKYSTSAMSVDRERITAGILENRMLALLAFYIALHNAFVQIEDPGH